MKMFPTTRSELIDNLVYFSETELSSYSKNRNFDLGPPHKNVSKLSPYLRTRFITEEEVLKIAVSKNNLKTIEKFIEEIFWRTYWRGWLESHPWIYNEFLNTSKDQPLPKKTGIKCFDFWKEELLDTGYLHNHSRMWFASIWIFTLELPWQLGAEFFMQHLYDGDAASNTLGWRWVAGVQTQGKHYLASEWNIKKFTNNRFQNIKLNENAPPKVSEKSYQIVKQDFNNSQNIDDKNLLIFENNLSFEITDFKDNKFKKI